MLRAPLMLLLLAVTAPAGHQVRAANIRFGPPTNLRVEGLLAVPSYFVPPSVPASAGELRGVLQVAVRVTVSATATGATVWDSGDLATDSTSVTYDGRTLAPFAMYSWTVAVSLSADRG